MNLNVTLEFACYTQYGEYMYLFIYGKTSGPTITPNVIATLPQIAVELYFNTNSILLRNMNRRVQHDRFVVRQ